MFTLHVYLFDTSDGNLNLCTRANLDVESSDQIIMVKSAVLGVVRTRPHRGLLFGLDQYRLIFNGKCLENGRTLNCYGISDSATLNMVPMDRRLMDPRLDLAELKGGSESSNAEAALTPEEEAALVLKEGRKQKLLTHLKNKTYARLKPR